jgi:hypothetical protein
MNRPGPTAPNPPGPGPGLAWLLGSTRNRLLAGLLVALLVSGALLTLTAVSIGRQSVRHAQENDARRLATLFEASLHNAMLQRDLAGLGHLLQTLGDAPGVARAGLLDIRGEVRFASDPAWLATTHTDRLAGLCLSAACPGQATAQIQWRPGTSGPALRIGISNGLCEKPGKPDSALGGQPMPAWMAWNWRLGRCLVWIRPALTARLALVGP